MNIVFSLGRPGRRAKGGAQLETVIVYIMIAMGSMRCDNRSLLYWQIADVDEEAAHR